MEIFVVAWGLRHCVLTTQLSKCRSRTSGKIRIIVRGCRVTRCSLWKRLPMIYRCATPSATTQNLHTCGSNILRFIWGERKMTLQEDAKKLLWTDHYSWINFPRKRVYSPFFTLCSDSAWLLLLSCCSFHAWFTLMNLPGVAIVSWQHLVSFKNDCDALSVLQWLQQQQQQQQVALKTDTAPRRIRKIRYLEMVVR